MATSRVEVVTQDPTKMDQDMAQHLFKEGATFVFLDVPIGTEFGIDCNTWEVGPEFKGVKMIPPGVHFVYYSAVGRIDHQVAPRTGFFYNFRQREVVLKRWDKHTEDIRDEVVNAEELERLESNKQELDRNLGVYPYETYKKWMSLTSHVTEALSHRLQPVTGKIYAVTQLVSERSTTQSRREEADRQKHKMETDSADSDKMNFNSDNRLPELKTVEGTEVRFTTIPRKKYPDGASPADITKYSIDHSYVLQTLLDTVYKDDYNQILGELQFAFVCFLFGQVYDGFNQWKQLVALLCSSEEAMAKHEDLYNNFISMMHYHIREIPEDFFVDIVSRNNFLVDVLHGFFENLLNSEVSGSLKRRGIKFREHLEKKFKWDFTSELEEYAPTVVE